ncbi:bifunctional 2-polyprenyl-6-hydroxyphenol methylase/3-demethylubiquinol 3-O-methyltransferase UbiG [Bacillus sp. EB600]|uniref:class I SAM-dependent methyltransferase n=1 Tax=Bacillus sp. EB600 TaxID=2806345 RepID=UPI002109DAF3|nr:class I SAM-dependent methyltransferase [Bacillus sp. EB600]MCQ6280799.1 class I SAM-dependent methyltransferase [Bacillus sp. EB600]
MNTELKWNAKHKEHLEHQREPVANKRLEGLSSYLSGGIALDIACGLGGNSLYLAKMNYQVQAVDISDFAINYIQEQAAKRKLEINPQKCDLTNMNNLYWANNSFNLAVITYYLDRDLFPIVKRIIRENGYFFMETFYQSSQNYQSIPNKYKLMPQELLSEFREWKILFFEENEKEGRQTIFCQKTD